MNGTAGKIWRVVHTPEQREYYHNTQTNGTSWVKPDELLTPAQLATGWTQTSDSNGKPYWYEKANTANTAWSPPAGWNEAPRPDPSE